MYTDEAIIKILGKTTLGFPDIDQQKLRGILEEVLCNYEMQPMSTALVTLSNMNERLAMFLASKKLDGLSDKTLKNYFLHLRRFVGFINKNAEDITTMDIRMYLAHIAKHNGLKNTSLETEKSMLKSFFNWLEAEDYIAKSPARKLKPTKTEKRLVEALTIEELEMLREACITNRERALIEVMYATGCRLSEVTGMNKSDIDYGSASARVVGKGNKERVVYFSSKAIYHLRKYLLTRMDGDDALFVTERKPYRRLGNRAIEKIVKQIAARTDIKKNVHPHVLRHTLATLMLNNGADISSVQEILGHTDPSTTQIYANVTEEHKREAYRKHLIQ